MSAQCLPNGKSVTEATHSLFNIAVSQPSGEMRGLDRGSGWLGDDVRAVNHLAHVVTEKRQLQERRFEIILELGLITCCCALSART